jgi:hypothetical protein
MDFGGASHSQPEEPSHAQEMWTHEHRAGGCGGERSCLPNTDRFRPLSGRTRMTAIGSSPAGGDRLASLRISTTSRALTTGHRNTTTGVRQADITDVIAISLPKELVPIAKGLSLGKPDETASRLLGMSPRTFSRRVAELLAYLEVETRFQAGMEVVQRWMVNSGTTGPGRPPGFKTGTSSPAMTSARPSSLTRTRRPPASIKQTYY